MSCCGVPRRRGALQVLLHQLESQLIFTHAAGAPPAQPTPQPASAAKERKPEQATPDGTKSVRSHLTWPQTSDVEACQSARLAPTALHVTVDGQGSKENKGSRGGIAQQFCFNGAMRRSEFGRLGEAECAAAAAAEAAALGQAAARRAPAPCGSASSRCTRLIWTSASWRTSSRSGATILHACPM